MNYLLVKEEQLVGQQYDYQYAERIPDGRVILPLSALKVLSNFTPEIISDDSLLMLIKEQKDSGLYNPPVEGEDQNQNTANPPQEDVSSENPSMTQEGGTE